MKFFYSAILFAFMGLSVVSAQIPDFSIAPDWTSVDINGNQHNLYNNLDSGYAVLIDLSAAWCAPCWTLHQGGLLQDLDDNYGPNGTNEMRVFYIESEASNSEDQLHGIGTSGSGANRATDTEGDWVSDHTYPFIDDASIAGLYQLGAYPTSVYIGTDRLTRTFVGAPGPTVQQIYDFVQNDAGPVVPGRDARLLQYTGQSLSVCGEFTPSILIQNHGTDTLEWVNLVVMADDSIALDTFSWSGSLLSYETTTIDMDAVDGTGYSNFSIVTIAPDADSTNNALAIEGLTVIGENTTDGSWDLENTDPAFLDLPEGLYGDPSGDFAAFSVSSAALVNFSHMVGGFEESDFSVMFDFFGNQTGSAIFYLDKIDVSSMANPTMYFNHAYKQYQAENDRLVIQVSDDCGTTWSTISDRQGSALATGGPQTTFFAPFAADWERNQIDLSAFAGANELVVRFVGVTAYGNNLWVDDIEIKELSSVVEEIPSISSSNLYPNPTFGQSTLEVNLTQNEDVNVFVVDRLGRVVQNVYQGELTAGKNNINVDAARLSSGLYSVVIQHMTEKTVNTLNLQVQ